MTESANIDPSADEQIGYTDALAELDGILHELEGTDVDVDQLAQRVERAAELIALCRGRIDRARLQIDRVVTDLGAGPDSTTTTDSP